MTEPGVVRTPPAGAIDPAGPSAPLTRESPSQATARMRGQVWDDCAGQNITSGGSSTGAYTLTLS